MTNSTILIVLTDGSHRTSSWARAITGPEIRRSIAQIIRDVRPLHAAKGVVSTGLDLQEYTDNDLYEMADHAYRV